MTPRDEKMAEVAAFAVVQGISILDNDWNSEDLRRIIRAAWEREKLVRDEPRESGLPSILWGCGSCGGKLECDESGKRHCPRCD